MNIRLSLLALILFTCMLLCPAYADRNLVLNGGFEQADPTNPNLPMGWTMSKSTDTTVPSNPDVDVRAEWVNNGLTGKCVSIYADNNQVIGAWDSSQIEVKPNHKYVLRFFYRVEAAGRGPGVVAVLGQNSQRICDMYLGEPTIWAQFEYVLDTKDNSKISVELMLYHRAKHRYFFDDIEIYDIGNAPVIQLPRDKSVSTSSKPAITWDAPDDQKVFTVQYSSEPSFKPGTTITNKGIKARQFVVKRPLADGTWFIRVTGADPSGEMYTSRVVSVVANRAGAGRGRTMDTTPPSTWGYSPVMDSREAASPREVSFLCEDQGGISPGSARMWIDGRSVAVKYEPAQGRVVCRPISPLASGRHIVIADIRDKAGNYSGKMSWGFFVQSDQPDLVAIGSNKNLIVNGRPFYMIGIYAHSFTDREKVIPLMAKSGMNTFWGGSAEENYRNNMKSLGNIRYWDPLPTIEQDMKTLLANQISRSVLLIYTTDEPDSSHTSLEELLNVADLVKSMDSNHPTAWIITMPDNYKAYAKCSDILVEDHYPVLKSSGIVPPPNYMGVARAVDLQNEAGGGKKPVFSLIQGIDFAAFTGSKVSHDEHRPTGDELLLMSYLAAIHGAKGQLIWTAGDMVMMDGMMMVAGRMRSLTPALLSPTLTAEVRVGPGSGIIESLAKRGEDGSILLITANPTQTPVLAGFAMKKKIKEVRVLFEDRTITPNGRSFSDIYQPASTHVYEVRLK